MAPSFIRFLSACLLVFGSVFIIKHFICAMLLRLAAKQLTDRVKHLDKITHLICLYHLSCDLDEQITDEMRSEESKDISTFKKLLREHMEDFNVQYKRFSLATCEPNMFNWLFKNKHDKLISAVEKLEITYNMVISDYDNFINTFKEALEANKVEKAKLAVSAN